MNIDCTVHRLPNGKWGMWFKDETRNQTGFAEGKDLYSFQYVGPLKTTTPIKEGRLDIQMRKPATLFVRMPEDVPQQRVVVQVDGQSRAAGWKGAELAIGQLAPAAKVTVSFPLIKRRTSETPHGFEAHEVDWVGDTIVAMQPRQGKIDRCRRMCERLTLREHCIFCRSPAAWFFGVVRPT